MKLTSMTNFVFQQIRQKQSTSEFKESVKKYAELLTQPLTLGMFVPCDKEGNVLEEPEPNDLCGSFSKMQTGFHDEVKYSEAKERVLFQEFGLSVGKEAVIYRNDEKDLIIRVHKEYKMFSVNGKQVVKIEELINYDLTLSDSAFK